MWTYLHWTGITHISGNLPAKEMLVDITRIHSKSPTLNPIFREHESLFTQQAYVHITYVQIII